MNGDIGDVFWIFIMFCMLQPWLRQKMLDSARVRLMHRIERQRGSRVILLVHRQETMSFLGIPLYRYIDVNDAEEVIRAIHLTDDGGAHRPGAAHAGRAGAGQPADRPGHQGPQGQGDRVRAALRHVGRRPDRPGGDEIVMDDHAVLGPVDPQLGEYPAASLVKVVKTKDLNQVDDKTLILADVGEKALHANPRGGGGAVGRARCRPTRRPRWPTSCSQGTWTHDHPIGLKEAQELGLPVHGDMPDEFYQLMALFPQPKQRQQSVQYLPDHYEAPSTTGDGTR